MFDGERALDVLAAHRAERRGARGDAGVGHHDVETAEALDGRRDDALHRAAVGHVGGEAERALLVDLRGCGLDSALVEVDEDDRRAALVQQLRGGEADPARRARDERDLALEVVGGHRASLPHRRFAGPAA